MGYSLSACVVDLDAIGALLGSKNEQLLVDLIETYREEMLEIDAGMEFFEDFEEDILAEYESYVSGDFSYHHPISEPDPGEDNDEGALSDEEEAEFSKALLSDDDESLTSSIENLLGDLLSDAKATSFTSADDIEPSRDLSTAGALVQMILGREMDPQMGHLYGYTLDILAFHFGESVVSSAYESLRSSFYWERVVAESARRRGIDTQLLSPKSIFFHRGSPYAVPDSTDFPSIGYLTADEASELKEKLLSSGLVPIQEVPLEFESEEHWGEVALVQLLNWVTNATRAGHGVMTVYC